MNEKKCKGCLEVKPLIDFYKYRPNSYRGKCKDCFQNNIKKWRRENKDLHNEYCTKWRHKNREAYNAYKREYIKENYDPVKKREQNMRYLYGNQYISLNENMCHIVTAK